MRRGVLAERSGGRNLGDAIIGSVAAAVVPPATLLVAFR